MNALPATVLSYESAQRCRGCGLWEPYGSVELHSFVSEGVAYTTMEFHRSDACRIAALRWVDAVWR